MFEIILSFIGVFLATYLLTPIVKSLGILDKPDSRKLHKGAIPLVGGIAMFTSIALASLFFVPPSSEMAYLLAACAMITMTGSIDDRFNIHYRLRLIVQIVASILIVKGANISLVSFGDVLAIGDVELGIFSLPITVLALVGMVNAFNMIDGIDGLAGGIALIATLALYFLIGSKIADGASSILLLLVGALFAYLILNLHLFPRLTYKIFMGDAGSMLLGLVITSFLIRYSQGYREVFSPVLALWLVAVPLIDIFTTTIRRIKNKKNPFQPDRTHLHHILMRCGFTKTTTLILILIFQIVLVSLGVGLESLEISEAFSFIAFILVYLLYSYGIKHAFKISKRLRLILK